MGVAFDDEVLRTEGEHGITGGVTSLVDNEE